MSKLRKLLLGALLCALTAGLVWAGAELLGQANRIAADAGASDVNLQMVSIETITKKPAAKAPNVNWSAVSALEKKMQANTTQFNAVLSRAKNESSGASQKVSDGTRSQGMKLANEFNTMSEDLAKIWDAAGNCQTRAKQARAAGASRLATAEMALSSIDADKVSASQKASEALAEARSNFLAEAKKDMDVSDLQALKSAMLPKAQALLTGATALGTQVSGLVSEVTNSAASVTSGDPMAAIGGCARQVTSSNSENPAMALLSPVKALSSMVASLISNIKGFISDLTALI